MRRPAIICEILGFLFDEGWRVIKEPSWLTPKKGVDSSNNDVCWEVACRRGGSFGEVKGKRRKSHIGYWGDKTLCFSGVGMRLRRELLQIAGVKPVQTGDEEFTVAFSRELLPDVVPIVRPYRRKLPPVS
jgi:hypothetical protein